LSVLLTEFMPRSLTRTFAVPLLEGGDSGFSVRARRYLDLDAATGVDSGLQRFGRVGSQLAKTLFGGRRFWALAP